jgi:DNA-binding LacI/PurR family transcriptional regulator
VHAAEGGRAAAEVTRHLLSLGHRTVHHIAGPQRWWAARERRQHWRDTLVAAGAEVPEPLEGDWTPASGFRIGQVLAADPAVTAIFAANDDMAIGAIHALHAAGRSVPGDVSVAGFDDIPVAAHVWPPLTTVSSDNAELAEIGLRYLADFLDADELGPDERGPDERGPDERGPRPAPPPEHVHQLVIRQSTAPPNEQRKGGRPPS